jgi:cyclohexadieny/prephenate dehydrogenase
MTEPLFDTIAIIGLGLIGSSVARGVKARGLARKIIGYDLSPQVHARAKELAFCHRIANTPPRLTPSDRSRPILGQAPSSLRSAR